MWSLDPICKSSACKLAKVDDCRDEGRGFHPGCLQQQPIWPRVEGKVQNPEKGKEQSNGKKPWLRFATSRDL